MLFNLTGALLKRENNNQTRWVWDWMNAQADARRKGQCGYVDTTHGCRRESLEYRMPEISTGHPITKTISGGKYDNYHLRPVCICWQR